jgi:hypothetical protein
MDDSISTSKSLKMISSEPKKKMYWTDKPWKIALISGALYAASLTQNAFTTKMLNKEEPLPAIDALLMGSTAILGGGLMEWFIWWANPLYFISLFQLMNDDRSAVRMGIVASSISFSFSMWTSILGSESGSQADIVHKGFGYWLWLLSMLTLTYGARKYFKRVPTY